MSLNRYRVVIHVAFAACVSTSCFQASAVHAQQSKDEQLIREARARSNAAIRAHDPAAMARLWMDDVLVVRSTGAQVAGRERNQQRMAEQFATRPDTIYIRQPSTIDLYLPWAMASERGEWTARWTEPDGRVAMAGTYMAQWRRVDGVWLIQAEIYVPTQCAGSRYCSAVASQKEDFASLEAEATRALRPESELFAERAALVGRLQSASQRAPDANQRARLALLWLRAIRSVLGTITSGPSAEVPYRDWLARHESVVVYSEPAGQWLLIPEAIWKVHDAHRLAAPSEAIAWFAIENGYPGECEGYIPCYANIMNWLSGEYLRRHPDGAHASDIVEEVHSSLSEAVKRLSEPDAKSYLNPLTDCGDLKSGLIPLREAIGKSNAARRAAAVNVIDELLVRCR